LQLHKNCASAKCVGADAENAIRDRQGSARCYGNNRSVRRTKTGPGTGTMKRLPPLTALEAFVEAARLGSVKAAAESLALSSPALTRRIQSLERIVGRPLFERRHQSIQLNVDGERLLSDVGPAVDALERAIARAAGNRELMRLRLAVPPLFASQRLMPNLSGLRDDHPELHIDLDTRPGPLARLDDGLDAVIALTTEVDPSFYSTRIDSNCVIAIGSRRLLEAPKGIRRPQDLARFTVFVHRDMPESFAYWCEAVGVPGLQPLAVDQFDSGQLILDAVAEGLGVGLMLESHLELANDDRLVPLFDHKVESPYSYWFACRRSAIKRRPVRIFHDWMIANLATGRAKRPKERSPEPSR
jgi:LysR family glycine cleavage system transcriptional activator